MSRYEDDHNDELISTLLDRIATLQDQLDEEPPAGGHRTAQEFARRVAWQNRQLANLDGRFSR